MLKVISTKQVRLGMFIQELKCPWIDHPFWKEAFKLVDPADLKKLKNSAVKEIIIDTSKGLDVEELDVITAPSLLADTEARPDITPTKNPIQRPAKISAAAEHEQAKRVIQDSKKAVASMFHDVRMGKTVSAETAMLMVDEIAASVDRNLGALISLAR